MWCDAHTIVLATGDVVNFVIVYAFHLLGASGGLGVVGVSHPAIFSKYYY